MREHIDIVEDIRQTLAALIEAMDEMPETDRETLEAVIHDCETALEDEDWPALEDAIDGIGGDAVLMCHHGRDIPERVDTLIDSLTALSRELDTGDGDDDGDDE